MSYMFMIYAIEWMLVVPLIWGMISEENYLLVNDQFRH